MAKIILFPNSNTANKSPITQIRQQGKHWTKSLCILLVSIIKIILAIFWTPIKWILSIDCFIQLLRTMYYWNTPDIHAGWVFLLHFSILTALMLFIASSNPYQGK
ncbi:KleE stable inheritance protein [Methylomonas sp. AM2-LC]|uniref:KleE stable inheritance protein n=1 Tax=Methylomonas sp. AM2-LC TaxID=3153301 RepID=UPI00326713DA